MRGLLMIDGYARVSTVSQELDVQLQALEKEGTTMIYKEKFTGTKTNRRCDVRQQLFFLSQQRLE